MSSISTGPSEEERKGAPGGRRRGLAAKWDGRDAFTIEEAGVEILGLSRSSSYAAANDGTIPTIQIGRRKIVPRRALEKLLGLDEDVPTGGQQVPEVVAVAPTSAPQRLELAIEVSTPRRSRSRKHAQTVEVISPTTGDR